MTMRVGIVGTGFGARVVAPTFAATPGCAVVDVVSARDDAAVAALCGRADVDLIGVHAPPFRHASIVDAAIGAGHAVLCDKPFGASIADARWLHAAGDAAPVVTLVNFEFRWEPARRYVRDQLRAGAIGAVEAVSWTHISAASRVPLRPYGWLFDAELGGGWLGAWGSHALDTLRWWLGDLTVDEARLDIRIGERPDATGVARRVTADDTLQARLLDADGAVITLDSTFAATASLAPRVVVQGGAGVMEVVADRAVVTRRADGSRDEWRAPPADGDPHAVAMRRWAAVVRDAVAGDRHPDAATFADGLAVAELLDAVRRIAAS